MVTVTADILLESLEGLPFERKALPILSNVRIKGEEEKTLFMSTDLEAYGIASSDVLIQGDVCVNLEKLRGLLKSLGNKDVRIDLQDQGKKSLTIETQNSRYSIPCLASEDFPEFPDITGDPVCAFSLDARDLKLGIDKTIFAVAKDEGGTSLSLAGMCLRAVEGELHFTGSDGHRLALLKVGVDVSEFTSIIPARAARYLSRLTGEVRVKKFESYVVFESPSITYIIREIEAEYPDYMGVIPREFIAEVELPRKDFKEAIERMIGFTKEFFGVTFCINSNTFLIRCVDPDEGRGEERIEPLQVKGQDLEVTFNPRYILDYLKKAESNTVWLRLTGKDTACVMGDDFTYVVMPMGV